MQKDGGIKSDTKAVRNTKISLRSVVNWLRKKA